MIFGIKTLIKLINNKQNNLKNLKNLHSHQNKERKIKKKNWKKLDDIFFRKNHINNTIFMVFIKQTY